MAALTMNGGVHDTAMPRGESGNTEFRCMCHDVLIYAHVKLQIYKSTHTRLTPKYQRSTKCTEAEFT